MGIRIHKTMGYSAPHPNKEALLAILDEEEDGVVAALIREKMQNKMDDYINHPDSALYKEKSNNKVYKFPKQFSEIIHSVSYEGQDEPFIIVPPAHMESWYRWDDDIDYVEEMSTLNRDDSPKDHYKILDRSLYPYVGMLKLDGSFASEYEQTRFMHREIYKNIEEEPIVELMPFIPVSVRIIATHLGFDWLKLRPTLGTWWG